MEPEPVVALNNAEARLGAAQEEEEAAILLGLSRQACLQSSPSTFSVHRPLDVLAGLVVGLQYIVPERMPDTM